MVVSADGELPMDAEQLRKIGESMRNALGPSLESVQETVQRSLAPMLEAQRKALEQVAAPLVQAHVEAMHSWVEANREAFIEPLLRAAETIREAWQEAIPPNLRELEFDSFSAALEMSSGRGPCVMWAPRAEIIEELTKAENFADRSAVLVERREEIMDDLVAVLDDANVEVVEEQRDAHTLAGLAIQAARHGHDAAAQALAGAALGCVLQEVLRYEGLGAAYKAMSNHDLEEASFGVLRLLTIESATSSALVNTEDHVEGFNRHGTLHGDRAFYGAGEMLSGLLLLVAWVRELSWWAEHDPAFLVDDADTD